MVQRANPEDYFKQGNLPEQNSLPARVNNAIEEYNPNTELLVYAFYALIVFAIVVIILAMIYFKSKER